MKIERKAYIKQLAARDFDVLIVGGGINGAVSASVLSGHGLKVALVDQGDFASGTSQESSSLIWGGIKYLESYEFSLVWDLCRSRNRLMRAYPKSIREIRFFTSVPKGFRKPAWMVFLGALLYWFMGRCFTRAPRLLSRLKMGRETPLINLDFVADGLDYSDAYLVDNDTRFSFKFIKQAWRNGAAAVNYVKAGDCQRLDDGFWQVQATDQVTGTALTIRAKTIVNAAGPWCDQFNQQQNIQTDHHLLFSKGIHLVVPQLISDEKVLAFFDDDGRLFFVIPMGKKTCIGTTDTRLTCPESRVRPTDIEFVLSNINQRLNLEKPLVASDIISSRCGVRPLVVSGPVASEKLQGASDTEDWMQLSRKHVVDVNREKQFISLLGGKLTDCLNIGEEVYGLVESMGHQLTPLGDDWYGEPSADLYAAYQFRVAELGLTELVALAESEPLAQRLWRRYGLDAQAMMESIAENRDLAQPCVPGGIELTRVELPYFRDQEMVVRLEDLMRRRSKLDLLFPRQMLIHNEALLSLSNQIFGEHEGAMALRQYFSLPVDVPHGGPRMIAHRGASAVAPENTMAAFKLAWENGAAGIELDIRLSADDKIVVIHDESTGRMGDEDLLVAEQSFERLSQLDVGSKKSPDYKGERLVVLEDVLDALPDGKQVFIEIKVGVEILPALKEVIARFVAGKGNVDCLSFIAFDCVVLSAAKNLMPEISTYYLVDGDDFSERDDAGQRERDWQAIFDLCLAKDFQGVDSHWQFLDKASIDRAHALGLAMVAWTVNDEQEARRLANAGLNAITSDNPLLEF